MGLPGPLMAESFLKLRAMNDCLTRDTHRCMAQISNELKRPGPRDNRDYLYASYIIKKAIRAFFGQVDGLAYTLRKAVLDCAEEMGLALSVEERALLSERRYDEATNSILRRPKYLFTKKSTLRAFEYFPRLFGSSYELNVRGVEWRSFERLVEVRNGLTHPHCLDDLSPANASHALVPTFLWFSQTTGNLIFDCARSVGIQLVPSTDAEIGRA